MKTLLLTALLFSLKAWSYGSCHFACHDIPDDAHVMHSFGAATTAALPEHVRIAAWNLYKGKDSEFSQDFVKLGNENDLFLNSETISADPVLSAMKNVSGYGWVLAASYNMKNEVATGTSIGSKAKAINPHFIRTVDTEPFTNGPRSTTVAEYAIQGKPYTLIVLSIHGLVLTGQAAYQKQIEQFIPEIKAHIGPVLLAGDFNEKSNLPVIEKVLSTVGMTRVHWDNAFSGQLDDAFVRDFDITYAHFDQSYNGTGSDHPAVLLEGNL